MTSAAALENRVAAAAPAAATPAGAARGMFARVAWRNLWRSKLRTWMSAGGIAFAVFLVSFFMALQSGTYGGWIEGATGLMVGHLQVQHADYLDDPKLGNALAGAAELVRRVEAAPGVLGAAPRLEAFALASVGERSYGALVMGVDAEREAALFTLPGRIAEGEYLPRADSAFLGRSLATNLGVALGDEVVVLGSSDEGGVAAMVRRVDGVFETGAPELDRSVMQVRLAAMQAAFEVGDAAHRLAVRTVGASQVEELAPGIARELPAGARLATWQELLPELEQSIRIDRVSALVVYWMLMLLVAASVVNAFLMTVFERTREFGMLLAVGMRPNAIVGMLTLEAVCVWALGAAIGLALCVAAVTPLSHVGINMAAFDEAMTDMAAKMMMPTSVYPALDANALLQSPLVMLAATLLAAWIPALRVRRMKPVDALREEE